MNDPELNLNSPSDLAGQVAALQRQVFTLLLALIVVSGTLAAYLGYESHHLGRDIAAINQQVVQPYNQKVPVIAKFLNSLVAFGRTHPDFQPLLNKYEIVSLPVTNAAARPAPSAAKPATAAPKK